jgi:hypothetical protein
MVLLAHAIHIACKGSDKAHAVACYAVALDLWWFVFATFLEALRENMIGGVLRQLPLLLQWHHPDLQKYSVCDMQPLS